MTRVCALACVTSKACSVTALTPQKCKLRRVKIRRTFAEAPEKRAFGERWRDLFALISIGVDLWQKRKRGSRNVRRVK